MLTPFENRNIEIIATTLYKNKPFLFGSFMCKSLNIYHHNNIGELTNFIIKTKDSLYCYIKCSKTILFVRRRNVVTFNDETLLD